MMMVTKIPIRIKPQNQLILFRSKKKPKKPDGTPPSDDGNHGDTSDDDDHDHNNVTNVSGFKGDELKNLKITFDPIPANTVGYEHRCTSTLNNITSAWYIDRKGAAESAHRIISVPTDDPVAAEALLDNGKFNTLDAVIQRAGEEVIKIADI